MKRYTIVLSFAVSTSLVALAVAVVHAGAQSAVPVRNEPRHHLLFENADVRAYDVIVPPGDATLFHVHALDYVYVVLADASLKSEVQGKPPTDLPVRRGDVRFTAGPITHRVENVGTTTFHNITVELVRPAPATPAQLTPLGGDFPAAVVLENARLRATRLTLQPGGTAAALVHPARTLLIPLDAGSLSAEQPGREPRSLDLKPGTAIWSAKAATETLRNAGRSTVEIVWIELK